MYIGKDSDTIILSNLLIHLRTMLVHVKNTPEAKLNAVWLKKMDM